MTEHDKPTPLPEHPVEGLAALIERQFARADRAPIPIDVEADYATAADGYSPLRLHLDELEPYRKAPRHLKAGPRTATPGAFLSYFKRFGRALDVSPVVFALAPGKGHSRGRFRCVFDYHETDDVSAELAELRLAPADGIQGAEAARIDGSPVPTEPVLVTRPRWGAHAVDLELEPDPIWCQWREADGKRLTQAEMAEFLEDHLPDIVRQDDYPDAATMLEVALAIEATSTGTFKRHERLQNGELPFAYEQKTTADAPGPSGRLQIPQSFLVGVPVYRGTARRLVEARFRYRINDGALRLSFHLVRPERHELDAFDEVRSDLRSHLPDSVEVIDVAEIPAKGGPA